MDWLLALLPQPLYYAAALSFLLGCLYFLVSDVLRCLDSLAERRQRQLEEELQAQSEEEQDSITKAELAAPSEATPLLGSDIGQDGGRVFDCLDDDGNWRQCRVKYERAAKSVLLTRKVSEYQQPSDLKKEKSVALETLQRIDLDDGPGKGDAVLIRLESTDAQVVTIRAPRATEAGQWLQRLLVELLKVRPKLAVPRPLVSDEAVTEKLKIVSFREAEAEAPSFSVDLLALLLKEFGVFATRTDLRTFLQKSIGKPKVETYRDTVDAVKDIINQLLDGTEIFQRYSTIQQATVQLMTVADFHAFVRESQGMPWSLPETLRQLKSLATGDADLLELLLVSRRVFRSAMDSKVFTMPLKPEQVMLRQPLDQPLTDYFISTSHNTYLMEDQLKGRSDCLAYEIALKKNCRCVELDIHNGPNNDPIITHGGTMTSRIRFEDVIKTIQKFAFVASEYPLILSFENHCSLEQQDKMAQILSTYLKDYLYVDGSSDAFDRLPSPEDLKRKIIIKNKKVQADSSSTGNSSIAPQTTDAEADDDSDVDSDGDVSQVVVPHGRQSVPEMSAPIVHEDYEAGTQSPEMSQSSPSGMDGPLSVARRYSSDRTAREGPPAIVPPEKKRQQKLKVSLSLSELVSICRPVKFRGQRFARENYRPVEMSSLPEGKMEKKQWLKKDGEDANKLVLHTQYQLVRIYPSGLRTNSSNYNPVSAWRFGCQLVALNYQTRCENMELNDGLFQLNGSCGYVPKPGILTKASTEFNPLNPSLSLARSLRLEIVSGTNLRLTGTGKDKEVEEKGLAPFVKITLYGVPGDEKKDQTKKADQGFNPRWNFHCFEEVDLVRVPDLAHLRLEAKDKNSGKVIGQFTAPLTAFSEGYRRIFLKDSKDMPTASELWIRLQLVNPA